MKPFLWLRMDGFARRLTPFGITLILVIVNLVPLHVPGFVRVAPILPLMAIYHWAVHKPELMPAYAVFLIGFLQDLLTGAPVGLNTMVYLIAYGTVMSQRRFLAGKSFAVIWLGFALVTLGAAAMGWLFGSILTVSLIDPKGLLFQSLLTLGLFPVLAWAFLKWQQAFLESV